MNSTPPGTRFRIFARDVLAAVAISGVYLARNDSTCADGAASGFLLCAAGRDFAAAIERLPNEGCIRRALIDNGLRGFSEHWPGSRIQPRPCSSPRRDQLLQAGQTPFGQHEATGVVGQCDDAEEADDESERRQPERKRRGGNGGNGDGGSEKESAASIEGSNLRYESKTGGRVVNANARDQRQPHADVVAVFYHD